MSTPAWTRRLAAAGIRWAVYDLLNAPMHSQEFQEAKAFLLGTGEWKSSRQVFFDLLGTEIPPQRVIKKFITKAIGERCDA